MRLAWTLGKVPLPKTCLTFLCYSKGDDFPFQLGYTPLAVAIAKRSEELVEFLLQKGADVHAQDKNKR